MSTVRYASDFEWQLGTCNSHGIEQISGNTKFIHRCCLRPGKYTLTCIRKNGPYGWNEGFVEIQGHRYCNDFLSYKLMQEIRIKGMKEISTKNKTRLYDYIIKS